MMRTRTYFYFLKQAIVNLGRNALMSIASIGILTVSLLILGGFILSAASINQLIGGLESQLEIMVFLKDSVSADEIKGMQADLQKLPDISEVNFISKDKAFKRLKEQMGNKGAVLEEITGNPLPNAFEVKAKVPEKVGALADMLVKQPQVEEVKYGKEVVKKLFAFTRVVRIIGVLVMFILSLATVYIIVNTIRLTVFNRRREVQIMKLVGATNWFVRWPFMLEGVLLGFIGALVAVVILHYSYIIIISKLQSQLPFLPLGGVNADILSLSYWLFLIGIILGSVGSIISLRKFLRV